MTFISDSFYDTIAAIGKKVRPSFSNEIGSDISVAIRFHYQRMCEWLDSVIFASAVCIA